MVNMDDSETFRSLDVGRRPPTEELVELHIYVVPSDKWIEKRKLAKKDIIDYAISSGFVRVLPSTTLSQLRMDIHEQLGYEYVPDAFVFLRSVGRNFTQVKPRQERELKVKSFTPPYAEEPEIYMKEGEYVAVRSASLGAEVPVSEVAYITHSDISFTSPEMAIQSSGPDILSLESSSDKRSQSLDRGDHRSTQTAQRPGRAQAPGGRVTFKAPPARAPRVPGQYRNTRGRPPTPRVKERPLGNLGKHRVAPVAVKRGKEDSIKEIPKESMEEDSQQQNHFVEIEQDSQGDLESSQPEPANDAEDVEANNSPSDPANEIEGKENVIDTDDVIGGKQQQQLESEENDLGGENPDDEEAVPEDGNEEDGKETEEQSNVENSDPDGEDVQLEEDGVNKTEDNGDENEKVEDENEEDVVEPEAGEDADKERPSRQNSASGESQEESQLSMDNEKSDDVIDESVLTDPAKTVVGETEMMMDNKDGREHFDEGFHSGELVASEEDNAEAYEVKSSKPVRAGTPMPRGSYYRPVNLDPEIEKMRLLYEEVRAERRLRELKRDALMQKARDLQRRKVTTRDQVREEWRKRYMEVKKLSPRLEDHCSKLRQELERLVREMLVKVRTTESEAKPHKPSKKTSYKIMIMRLLQEVEDLRRRLQSAAIRLNAETKLRDQAEYEVKKLRQDLLQKKTQVTLTRKQAAFARPSQPFFISAV